MATDEGALASDAKDAAKSAPALKNWAGDASGAIAAALIAIPQAMSLGVLAFAALGPAYAALGVVAGLLASVIGNLVVVALPAARCQIMGARSSATVVFAAMVAALAAHPLLQTADGPDPAQVITVAFAALLGAGVLQVVFGLTGLGRAVRFVPHPVAAGFMNGIALMILLSQLAPALGADAGRGWLDVLGDPASIKPGAFAVTLSVVAGTFAAKRFLSKLPEAVCGLAAGVFVHYGLAWFSPGTVGPLIGALPEIDLGGAQLESMLAFPWSERPAAWGALLFGHALVLAVVIALDGLVASMVGDSVTHTHHDSRRLLLGQGMAGIAGAVFGALPALANAHTRVANYVAGGRTTRGAAFLHSVFLLVAVFALAPVVSGVPIAALAGVMIYIALLLLDRWTSEMLGRLGTEVEHRGEIALNVAIVLGVALALPLFNVMAAFALGVAATVILLLAKLSGSPVRRRLDGTVRASLKVRDAQARAALRPLARSIRILELEGEIFFGTAEALRREIGALAPDTRYAILDFRRVIHIDASGARVLQMIGGHCRRHRIELLLAHVQADEPRGRYLRALGLAAVVPEEHWFRDLDRALEWAEDHLLQRARFEDAPELAPAQMSLFAGLDESELAVAAAALERHELAHGEMLFSEGEAGERLFLIARGFVSIKVKLEDDPGALRLATFSPGVFFGEAALLEGTPRSSDAFAKGERVVLYSLSRERFAELVRLQPQAALKIYQNMSRELAARVRAATQALRALE